jgi:hypothetical protein
MGMVDEGTVMGGELVGVAGVEAGVETADESTGLLPGRVGGVSLATSPSCWPVLRGNRDREGCARGEGGCRRGTASGAATATSRRKERIYNANRTRTAAAARLRLDTIIVLTTAFADCEEGGERESQSGTARKTSRFTIRAKRRREVSGTRWRAAVKLN